MSKMIQIRNVPDELHRTLKVRAASTSMSLSDYLLTELREIADKPTLQEWVAEVRADPPIDIVLEPGEIAELIRRDRDSH